MKILRRPVLLLLMLLACPMPARAADDRAETLEKTIQALLKKDKCRPQKAAVTVINHAGAVAVSIQSDTLLKPASNMKLLTTAAAVCLLGPNHAYRTLLTAGSPIVKGQIQGDLTIRGTGDPNISGRFHDDDPMAIFNDWAARLKKLGLKTITGDLVVDDSYFDGIMFNPHWNKAQEGRWYSAQVSPLSLNDNCLDITIKPTQPGKPARVIISPPSSFITVKGAPTTVAKGKTSIIINRKTQTNIITIKGTIHHKRSHWKDYVTVHDPALFFAHTLKDVFASKGITLKGGIKRIPPPPHSPQKRRHILIQHVSPLSDDLPVINRRSQNLHAEILLKTLGMECHGQGSVAGGAKAVKGWLDHCKIPAKGILMRDGSGLSHENRLTTGVTARLLHAMTQQKLYPAFLASLAVAGKAGTLDDRFKSHPRLAGAVFGKTGRITGVSCLSGYVVKKDRTWSFSIFLNSFPRGSTAAKRLEENIVAAIHKAM